MGNQLYTIAGVIGLATRSFQPYGFPEWINRDNALFGGQPDVMSQYFVNPLPGIGDIDTWQDYPYWWGYRDLVLPTGNWNMHAHFQSPRFFAHCMPLIRETFRMKDEPEQNDYVAIHYRAGDYQEGEDCHHPRQRIEYYLEAMALFPAGTGFMLFSDDIPAIEKLRHNKDYFIRTNIASGTYIEDFALMKRCKSFITANSSFSAFAALLGEHPDKKIVMPANWFGKAFGPGYKEMSKDIYPDNAIVI